MSYGHHYLHASRRRMGKLRMWVWEEVDVSRSGSSGDMSKLFRNELIKRPGVFAVRPPPADATIMAREVIQNSWDAARELRLMLGSAEPPDFDIDFTFRRYTGQALTAIRAATDFDGLARRAEQLHGKWTAIGLRDHTVLADRELEELPTLIIEERGASGMYGPWRGAESKMYLAMVSIGFTQKAVGAGGSYGYGKAGLIRGSNTRTVVAYSCFPEQPEDPGVTRRLLGMTYWGPHSTSEGSFTGFARLGKPQEDDSIAPFENDEADALAVELGLDVRSPEGGPEEYGTTFVLLDPTVDPDALRRAVERNWWPALLDDPTFNVEIHDEDGADHRPKPRQVEELQPFMRGYEIAITPQDAAVEGERRVKFQPLAVHGGQVELGSLGLVGARDGWSYPASDDKVDHRSLVALVRGPRMVVEYFEAGQARPFVRGTFVADGQVDDLLRQTEPRGHDAWQMHPGDDSIDSAAPHVARSVMTRIRNNVNAFRKELKPPVPDRRELRLPELERLFNLVVQGEGTKPAPPPRPSPREVSIHVLEQTPEVSPDDPSLIRLRTRIAFALSDNYRSADSATVRLGIRCKFIEDDRAGQECPMLVEWPKGFDGSDDLGGEHLVRGALGREYVEVLAVSDPYPPDWSTRLVAEGDVLEGTQHGQ